MGHQPTTRQVTITKCSLDNEDYQRLYRIFRLTICPGMSEKAFESYYRSDGLEYIDVSFFYTASGNISGFLAAAFYNRGLGNRPVTIARSAIGFLPQHRGGALQKWKLYSKYMMYKWRHPGRRLVLTIYASNPFVYSMVCKYTGVVYPRTGQSVPAGVVLLKNDILESSKMQRRERQPFVVRINFEVEKSAGLRQQAIQSTNRHVCFFVQQTGLQPCMSLLVIIPVSLYNILLCVWWLLWYGCTRKVTTAGKCWLAKVKNYKNRLTCWLKPRQQASYANEQTM